MVSARVNRVLDKLHAATVAVLITSTVYFGFEAVRATMAIQEHRYKMKQVGRWSWCWAASTAANGQRHGSAAVVVSGSSSSCIIVPVLIPFSGVRG